jgi:hypothetical protein
MPENSIALNLEKIQPVLWLLIFLLLPLERYVNIGFGSELLWNITHLFLAAALYSLYRGQASASAINSEAIRAPLLISLVIIFAFVAGEKTLASWQATSLLLVITWLAPPLATFIRRERRLATHILLAALVIHSLWAIAQFSLQADINLAYLGETSLEIGQPGIATFASNDGTKLVRPYGPYPHPNALAGSMLLGLIALTQYSGRLKKITAAPVFTAGYLVGLAVLLSFSRAAWIGFAILFFVACLTHTKKIRVLVVLITLLTCMPLLLARSPEVGEAAVTERWSGTSYALGLLNENPLWHGVGPGNYEHVLADYFKARHIAHEPWQVTPVHATPLLLLVEWGSIPALALVGWCIYTYAAGFRRTWPLLLPLIPLLWFDHYLLTQAPPLLYLVTVLILLYEPRPASSLERSSADELATSRLPPR